MSFQRLIVSRCDYQGCTEHHEYPNGSIIATRVEAIQEHRWVRRGAWDFCPHHRNASRAAS